MTQPVVSDSFRLCCMLVSDGAGTCGVEAGSQLF